ncbi:Uncharacterized protein SCF082_LOCUS18706 [Durusdinium trenchii]|uniref:Plastid lipid-associated protein/fibrillin conserved domain-containing protein n=1 Tax=Durusdinium trenchii TaxID=1381693 RepID=A0ABP0KQS7_9DINO
MATYPLLTYAPSTSIQVTAKASLHQSVKGARRRVAHCLAEGRHVLPMISAGLCAIGATVTRKLRRPCKETQRSAWAWPWEWGTATLAAEIRDLLLAAKGDPLEADARQMVEQGIDRLAEARVACPAELLGFSSSPSDGLWRSVFIQGKTPKWEENARLLRPLVQNKVGQAYDAGKGRVTNYGEILGAGLHFVAEGSFTPVDDAGQCPKEFDVKIEQGGLVILGVPLLSTAISGPGLVRVLYIDEDIRIFESPTDSPDRWEEQGLRVIQVRDQLYKD